MWVLGSSCSLQRSMAGHLPRCEGCLVLPVSRGWAQLRQHAVPPLLARLHACFMCTAQYIRI